MNAEAVAPATASPDEQDTLVTAPPPNPDDQDTLVMNPPDKTPPSIDFAHATDEELARSLRIDVVDASHGVTAKSADRADAYMAEQTTQHGFKGFIKKIWYGNIARDPIRMRQVQKGREEIVKSGNLGVLEDRSQAEHEGEMSAVVSRFTNEWLQGGERQDRLKDKTGGDTLEGELRTLVNFFAQGHLDASSLEEQKTRLLDKYKGVLHAEDRNKGLLLADNVIEVAQNARAALRHGIGMERVMAALSAYAGEAKVGQKTEARREMTDKIVDKLYSHKIGSLVNETTLSVVAGVAMAAAKLTTRKATTAAAVTLTMGLGAGVIAGTREHAQIGRERQQHIRERAIGEEMPSGDAKRREQLEETRYNTVAATALIDQLSQAREAVSAADPASIQVALEAINETEARLKISDERAVDLISFSSGGSVERDRLKLLITLAESKVAAGQALDNADQTALQAIGLAREDISTTVSQQYEKVSDLLNQDISEKDAAFATLRRNRTLKMAAVGFVSGEVIGGLVQEARAAVSESLQGVFDGNNGQVDRQTLLAGVLGHHAGSLASGERTSDPSVLNVHEAILGKHAAVDLPPNYHLNEASPGHWNVFGPDGKPAVGGLSVDAHGHLTTASHEALVAAGFHTNEQIQSHTTHHLEEFKHSRTPEEFLRHHPGDFTEVQRQLWYDNNTPHVFDQNELKLWWGGANNTGLDEHGNYVFNAQQMMPDGSSHNGFSANAQHLIHEGKMAIALSMTEGTQSHVVMIPIDEHGNAIIKANSWMAHSMFAMKDGQAHFNGAYAEAVQLMGKHNGVERMRMLATVVGSNSIHNISDVTHHLVAQHHERVLTHIHAPVHGPEGTPPIEIPGVLPIYARRGLEKLEAAPGTPYGYGYGYEEEGEDWEKAVSAMVEERSPRLVQNPEASLNPAEELNWYRDELEKRRGQDGLQKLEAAIDSSPELREMSGDVETIVTLPVAAIQEADTLYKTLSLYGRQSKDSLDKSLILLNLNWIDTAATKRGGQSGIEKARKAIERARKDFPDMKVAVVENEYEQEAVEATGGVIGYVAADLADTALLAIQKRMQDGVMSPDHEVLLIRNDADPEGLSRNYLESYQKALSNTRNKDIDVLKGVTRFGVRWAEKYPGFAVASNFASALSIQLSSRGLPATGGANFGIKASTLAAVGGLGTMTRTGAGSDDGALGRKIRLARWGVGVFPRGSLSQETVLPNGTTVPYRTVAAHVSGATVDTNPSRLVPYYLRGRSYANAWGSDFSNGHGGYRDRLAGTRVTPSGRSELAGDWDMQIKGIEETITGEMHWNNADDVKRALSIFFGHVPGAYTVTGDIGESDAQFKLTDVGKQYLKKRFEQEGYGRGLHRKKYGDRTGVAGAPLLSAS